MTKRIFVLKDIAAFASGAFENTAVEGGGIRLGRRGTSFLPSGCYTSPPYYSARFTRLIPSWNADTPPGTNVEMEVRISVRGQWSRWFSFGRWSPYIPRSSPEEQSDGVARSTAEGLYVAEDGQFAEIAQARIFLNSEDADLSPRVNLIALSANAAHEPSDEPPASYRDLYMPCYSCLARDPAISGFIGGATSLAMLLNRWGEDVLPEEIARTAHDFGTGRYSNMDFLAAVGGTYGYECFAAFAGTDFLREEVWRGRAVAALVHYRAPSLSGDAEPDTQPGGAAENGTPGAESPAPAAAQTDAARAPSDAAPAAQALPVLPGAHVNSSGHFVVVRGFVAREGGDAVLVHDPMSPRDADAAREIPLNVFTSVYQGICMVLRPGPKHAGGAKPHRTVATLALQNGTLSLLAGGTPVIPGPLSREDFHHATLCYTLALDSVFPTAAQRQFYYPQPADDGTLSFDCAPHTGKRITFYAVTPLGKTWTAEHSIKDNC